MLATREAVGYFRDRHLGLCGFGIMDGAGGGLGHDVTVPGSHVIIGEPGIILYSFSSGGMHLLWIFGVRLPITGVGSSAVNSLGLLSSAGCMTSPSFVGGCGVDGSRFGLGGVLVLHCFEFLGRNIMPRSSVDGAYEKCELLFKKCSYQL